MFINNGLFTIPIPASLERHKYEQQICDDLYVNTISEYAAATPSSTSEIVAAWSISVDEVSVMFTSHERMMKEVIKSDTHQRVAEAQAGVDTEIERAMSDASRHLESTELSKKELDMYSQLKGTLIDDVWFRTHFITGHPLLV